jgi:hypothetical protein
VSWDDPSYRYALDHGWLPALRRLGYTPEISYVKVPDSFDGVGASSAAVSSAVLRFQSHGIDHVLINDGSAGIFTGAGLTLLFLNSAESQRYWPRYGFNSFNAPGFSGLPADQQRGMLAVSWTDFEPTDDAGWRANRARDLCFKILRDGGAEPSDAISRFEAAAACDVLFLIDRVISGADRLTVAAFMAAATALGTSYESPYVYRTRLAPNQRDGANGVRNSRYDDSCTCMRYTSAPYTPQ